MTRPSFDEVYMCLASCLAKRSTCSRTKVGCVIVSVDRQRVLAVGYNGNWRGGPNACDSAEVGNCGCLHAEDNACIKLDFNDPTQKIIYTTVSPCVACAKRIVNAGITEVVYLEEYRRKEGLDILHLAGIPTCQLVLPRDLLVEQDRFCGAV